MTNDNSHFSYLNEYVGGNYQTRERLSYTHYDYYMNKAISYIPLGSTVAIQNNIPQLTSNYRWVLPTNKYNGSPMYILDDPYSIWFYNATISPGSYTNFIAYSNMKLQNGYGIVYEAVGITLLEENYTGSPVYFVSYTLTTTTNSNIRFLPPGLYLVHISFKGTINIISNNIFIGSLIGEDGIFTFFTGIFLTTVQFLAENYGTISIIEVAPNSNAK